MTKVKVSEASGPVLDWMVAKREDKLGERTQASNFAQLCKERGGVAFTHGRVYSPSTDWAQGGPIIDRMMRDGLRLTGYTCLPTDPTSCQAQIKSIVTGGPTALIAAMRCYVASKLGEEVEVPDELTGSEA